MNTYLAIIKDNRPKTHYRDWSEARIAFHAPNLERCRRILEHGDNLSEDIAFRSYIRRDCGLDLDGWYMYTCLGNDRLAEVKWHTLPSERFPKSAKDLINLKPVQRAIVL